MFFLIASAKPKKTFALTIKTSAKLAKNVMQSNTLLPCQPLPNLFFGKVALRVREIVAVKPSAVDDLH